MRPKTYPILVWFLSNDLKQSAEWLSNKYLAKSISGCMNAMICARFYFIGIRNIKAYKYFFDKERKTETLERFFPLWPLKLKPAFNTYKTRLSKWTRMCKEHYDYMLSYMEILLSEYEYRYKKPHGLLKLLEWEKYDAPKLDIPVGNLKGIVIPWKVLNPLFRDVDIYAGYRKQYKVMLLNYSIKITDFKNRDIPEWLIDQKAQDKWME